MKDFINLAVLGMMNYSSNNNLGINIWLIVSIIIFIINILIIIKNKDKMTCLFLFAPLGFIIPICDLNHFSYLIFCLLVIYLTLFNINYKYKYTVTILISSLIFIIGYFLINFTTYKTTFYNSKHYPNFYTSVDFVKINNYADELVSKYKMNNYILLGENAVFYNINHNRDINYYTNLFYGNFGYDGDNRIIKEFNNKKDTYFIINVHSYKGNNQFDNYICDYIFKNYKLINKDYNYYIYYKK